MAGIDSLDTLLEEELKDIYDAEKQLTKALPKMAKKATAEELKTAFQEHLQQTEQHIERLEQVFESLELPARGKKCEGMRNLIKEGEDMIGEAEDDATRDAVMIAAAQKVEHYEIAAYGTLRTWANLLGQTDAASLFEETLDEEKETDKKLTQIAESFVNQASAEEGEEEEEEEQQGTGSRAQMRGAKGGSASRSSRPQAAADRSARGGNRSASTRSRAKSR
jgi:ferritin-like metal-binding protein YciE